MKYECSIPPYIHWSMELKRCETPEIANCDPDFVTPPTDTTITTSSTTTSTSSYYCPADNDPWSNPIFFPHETDCRLYFMVTFW